MSLPTVPTLPFVPDVTPVPASVLNAWRSFFPACLDADEGGEYANLNPIIFLAGSAGIQNGGPFTQTEFSRRLGRYRRRPRVILTAANQTIDTSQGDCFVLPGDPGGAFTITLRNGTAPDPEVNERIVLVVDGPLISGSYQIRDEVPAVIAQFFSNAVGVAVPSAEFELDGSPKRWHMGLNSGFDVGTAYGVRS